MPRPRASGAGDDAQLPLALAAASVVVPILGPIALWLVQRASLPFRLRGDLEPASLRHARLLAITGTVLLVLLFVCFGPTLLVVG